MKHYVVSLTNLFLFTLFLFILCVLGYLTLPVHTALEFQVRVVPSQSVCVCVGMVLVHYVWRLEEALRRLPLLLSTLSP